MSAYVEAHANPQGRGDARPTAMQIVEDEGLVGTLAGKVFLVTGCSSGIGIETARALHATGGDVYITARDAATANSVVEDIRRSSGGQGKLEVIKLELDSLESVRACAQEFMRRSDKLNVLICNAGVMACPEGRTKDGFETQFGINHLGHFLLFELLKPALLKAATPERCSRVVMVSAAGHMWGRLNLDDLDLTKREGGYDPWVAYGASKTANIYMALEIERRFGAQGLHANSLMPGCIRTNLKRHVDDETLRKWNTPEMQKIYKSPEQGAATTVWAAVSRESESSWGKYLEDCGEAKPVEGEPRGPFGYMPFVYDGESARRLWEISEQLVGVANAD